MSLDTLSVRALASAGAKALGRDDLAIKLLKDEIDFEGNKL